MLRIFSIIAVCAVVAAALIYSPARPALASPPEAGPVSLINPDGQALNLEKYDLRVAVHGALSLVEMEMTFRNPLPKQMEGRFSYTLPPGAVISRFAKEVNGKLMEGEVVERLRAQAIFTEILHTMRDPALLEADQGNKFSARVFPVPANGTVRLLLSYSKLLPAVHGERKLTIPLAGMPQIKEFNATVIARPLASEAGTAVLLDKEEPLADTPAGVSKHADNFTPVRDLELTFKTPDQTTVRAIKAGNVQMIQFNYEPGLLKKIGLEHKDFVCYFDTSASNADSEAARLQVLDVLLGHIASSLQEGKNLFSARAFDIDVADLCTDTATPAMPEIIHKLQTRHCLGATDLGAALKRIGDEARASQKGRTFVLVSDGIPTWGAREPKELLEALGAWPEKDTLHAVVIGSKQDERILKAILEKTRGRLLTLPLGGNVPMNCLNVTQELQMPPGENFEVYDEAAEWIYPATFKDVRVGQELIAFAKLKEGGKSAPGFVQRGENGRAVKDTPVIATPLALDEFAPLLQREATRAYLDVLDKKEQVETDAMKRAQIHQQRVETSVKNRVLCPLTSLLVLESEADYRRFKIDRSGLPEILEVTQAGIHLRKRDPSEVPPPKNEATWEMKAAKAKEPPGERNGRGGASRLQRAEGLEKSLDEAKDFGESRKAFRDVYRQSMLNLDDDAKPQDREAEQLGRANNALGANVRFAAAGEEPQLRELSVDAPHPVAAAPFGRSPERAPVASTTPPESSLDTTNTVRQGGLPAQDGARMRELRTGLATSATASVQGNVEWTTQAKEIPGDAVFSELRARIQADPHDRKLRNAYADALCRAQKWDSLQAEVFQWLPFDPENPAVYEYLGKSAAGLNDPALALRAYSSIAEIAPNRAALLNRAGFLLLATQKYAFAEALFREALKNRQDDCNIYRGLALTLTLSKQYERAASEYEAALMRDFNPRYGDTKRVLREEYGYLLRAWRNAEPAKSDAIVARAERAGVNLLASDALRATLCWETDANDVDLHIVDPNNEECFYSHKNNVSGLELYSDQTQGLGPEVIRSGKTIPGTYHIGVNYFSAGPMGVSRGVVVIHKPVNGIDEQPQIVPFCLIEGGRDMRLIGSVSY